MTVSTACIEVQPVPFMDASTLRLLLENVAVANAILTAEPCDCTPYADPMRDGDVAVDCCMRCSLMNLTTWPVTR